MRSVKPEKQKGQVVRVTARDITGGSKTTTVYETTPEQVIQEVERLAEEETNKPEGLSRKWKSKPRGNPSSN